MTGARSQLVKIEARQRFAADGVKRGTGGGGKRVVRLVGAVLTRQARPATWKLEPNSWEVCSYDLRWWTGRENVRR